MKSFRHRASQIIRSGANAHRFVCFMEGRIRSFSTQIDDINSQVAELFGALNATVAVCKLPHAALLATALALTAGPAFALDPLALPTGYQSVSGNHTFEQGNGVLNVTTGASRSIVNYDTFNIGSGARVNFNLPSSGSSILNRVTGGGMSEIYGTLSSNGRVFLVNPAGIFFGNGANVSVNGLVASTLNITDQKFLAGAYDFTRVAGSTPGHIEVASGAVINVLNGGSASFIGSSFANHGIINAPNGAIQIGVGDRVSLGNDLVGINVTEGLKETLNRAAILNTGLLSAAQVKVIAATVKQSVMDTIVNNSGRISANKVIDGEGGSIELIADNGLVNNGGTLDASGANGGRITLQGQGVQSSGELLAMGATGLGGAVNLLATDAVALADHATINVSGVTGGGVALIGGDYLGGNPAVPNGLYTYVGRNVAIQADALQTGNGGKVIVWGNEATQFFGDITARGGLNGGNGGFVETSGKHYLDMQGTVDASARSAQGLSGTWLLDPRDVFITNNDAFTLPLYDFGDNTWTYNPTSFLGFVSTIKAASINAALNLGTNVTIHTANYGVQQGDIRVQAGILKSSGGKSTLSLLAADDIFIDNTGSIAATGSNALNVILKADNNPFTSPVSNGDGSITLNGSLNVLKGDITLSGQSVTLNHTLKTGSGAVSITALGGDITQAAAGSAMAGTGLSAQTLAAGKSIQIGNADFQAATLKTSNGNITYADKDGVIATVNAGNGTASLIAGDGALSADNAQAESGLTLSGANQAGTLNLIAKNGDITQAAGSGLTATNLNLSTTSGNVALNADNANDVVNLSAASNSGNVRYQDQNGVNLTGVNLNADNNASKGNLSVETRGAGDITQTGAVQGVNALSLTTETGNATLTNAANDAVSLNASSRQGNIRVDDANDLSIAGANLNTDNNASQGDLAVRVHGTGAITQTGAITGVNQLSVTTDTGAAVLTHANNDVVSLAANSQEATISYNDANDVVIAGANLDSDAAGFKGNLLIRTNGAGGITQTGAITGVNNLSVTTDTGNVTLTHPANDAINLAASSRQGHVSYEDANDFTVTSANLNSDNNASQGDLSLRSHGAGNITQGPGSIVGVNTLSVRTDSGNVALTFNHNNVNNLKAETNQGAISYRDADNLNVLASNLNLDGDATRGNLSLSVLGGGNISQSGTITGADTLKLRTDLGNATLMLDNDVRKLDAGSNFGSVFFTNAGSFDLTGANMNLNGILWKGDLDLTAHSGVITQSAAINASELKVTGNATLTNPNNTVDVFAAFGNGATVSFTDKNGFNLARTDVGNGTLNLGAVSGDIDQAAYFFPFSAILRNRNITENGALAAGAVNLTLGHNATAQLTRTGNAFNQFSLVGDGGMSRIVDSLGLNVTGVSNANGGLALTVLNGNNLTQSGPIVAKGLKVTVDGGGDFTLSNHDNNVQVFSGNATGVNTASSQGVFTDGQDGFQVATSDMQDGDLTLTARNGGDITQDDHGGIRADELKVRLIGGGDADLTAGDNRVHTFAANARSALAGDSAETQVAFKNNQDLNIARSNLRGGDLSLTVQGDLRQDAPDGDITRNGVIRADELKVTLLDGGSGWLMKPNQVNAFSGNALGEDTRRSQLFFHNDQALNIADSRMNDGDLALFVNGDLRQGDANGNITRHGAIQSDELLLVMLNNHDATLNNDNQVNSLSANATGEAGRKPVNERLLLLPGDSIGGGAGNDGPIVVPPLADTTQILFTNVQDLNLAASRLGNGDLGLTLKNGAHLNQDNLYHLSIKEPLTEKALLSLGEGEKSAEMTPFTGLWHSRDILSNGGVQANELKVTMIGGGNADLTTQANRVDVFSGNAFFLSDLSTVRFNNLGDLNLAHSEMGNGRLFVATQGNLDNGDRFGNDRNITQNGPQFGRVIDLTTLGAGSINIFNDIHGGSAVRLTTANNVGDIHVHDGATVASFNGGVYLNSNALTLDGYVQGQLVQLWPWDLNLSMGVGGGAGGLQLSQGLVDHINTALAGAGFGGGEGSPEQTPGLGLNTIMFGHQNYGGVVTLGTLNMTGHPLTNVAFNAPRVFESTPTRDNGFNLIMAPNRDVFFTAGADRVENWAGAPGGRSFGDNTSFFGDLDIQVSGSGLIHVKLLDFVGEGNTFAILTGGGNKAFINVAQSDNSNTLKNLAATLSNRIGTQINNQVKGTTLILPGNPVSSQPTSYAGLPPVQFIPNQSL